MEEIKDPKNEVLNYAKIAKEREKELYINNLIKNGDSEAMISKSFNGQSAVFEESVEKQKKSTLIQIIISALAIALAATMLYISIPKTISDEVANDYMHTTIVSSLEKNDVEYTVTENGIDITESNSEKIRNFTGDLSKKDFETNEILYGVREVLGKEDADIVAKSAYGYEGGLSDYIDKKYDFDGANGITEEQQFETSRNGYKENIEHLIEMDEIGRGMKK